MRGDAETISYEEEDTQKGKFLTFSLEYESYALEIKYVTEIIRIQTITEVPELPDYIRGIINLRGNIIPVMDIRIRFKKPFREYNDRTCVIVVDIKNVTVGVIVDSVSEVLTISEENIIKPPETLKGFSNKYIKGIGKVENDVKLILDCDKLLNINEAEMLSNI
ncbi:purine-binding chemotaxis protein CheW [Clostridium tetanomorphum]|uniref:Purine-binding chemotaxis protein CheW n=1 Tax=Clostridium tetanomorphum TaxID=1553 RepID=A0A923E9I0_CLOTT|nr:chemotaxis protein CheW [Clostridium tetanomorphum]KAJ49533.1 chemotaxis signal transduction protein [Clostridium tetanomorphum DSM 665]KAJ52183.1 chemotaxis signal transduction protein [Clostridium tetanomorphum DSM 665]MBC2398953.1 purine-binding chemotaxis protein CheW [Clostridium tetanomorphum]MBP1866368.1 purine-binding chemotaxis protein CheW [Clostridium tetanomorphum]NRS86545.1 purine-binding chemotaxis protein CheW [Clostridium tetanomorphum]